MVQAPPGGCASLLQPALSPASIPVPRMYPVLSHLHAFAQAVRSPWAALPPFSGSKLSHPFQGHLKGTFFRKMSLTVPSSLFLEPFMPLLDHELPEDRDLVLLSILVTPAALSTDPGTQKVSNKSLLKHRKCAPWLESQ